MTNRKLINFNIAREISKNADYNSPKKNTSIGCIVVYHNRIISSGYNSNKTSPIQKKYNKFRGFDVENFPNKLHAEISALSKIKYLNINWQKVEVYVYRENKDTKTLVCARPCVSCMTFIKYLGIKNIFYTDENYYVHENIINGKIDKIKQGEINML
jgi:deoxycytidylate deaminase